MNNTDLIEGEDVKMYVLISSVYYLIGCATSITFRFNNEIIFKTSINSPGSRQKAIRISDGNGSVSGLIKRTHENDVVSTFWFLSPGINRAEATYKFEWTDISGDVKTIVVPAIIESLEMTGTPEPGFAEFDLNIEFTGEAEIDIVSPPEVASGSQIDSETYTISGGNNYIEHEDLENVTIIEVDHEGTQFDSTSGSPSGRQFKYTSSIGGKGRIEFEAAICIDGQKVFVIWLY